MSNGNRRVFILTKDTALIQWLAKQGMCGDVVPYLDIQDVMPGDIVIGAPPIWLGQALLRDGIRVFILYFERKPVTDTGRLSVKEMEDAGVHLQEVTSISLLAPLKNEEIAKL